MQRHAKVLVIGLLGLVLAFIGPSSRAETVLARPNIVYILADDLGYGDVHCLNPESKIATPHLDRLAKQGMSFTDAHSGSSVCTPTRYGILTGRYAWRTRLKSGVLGGYSPPLIEPGRLTVASLLKQQGYRTACIGKWHLGFDWATSRPVDFGDAIEPKPKEKTEAIDYGKPIRNGPIAQGFDEYFGISASLDMPPFIYIQDECTVGVPTTVKTIVRSGPAHEGFEAVDVLPTLTDKAVEFLDRVGSEKKARPFFLYFPLPAPHAPIVPDDSFRGKSKLGDYADFVMQVDATVGRLLEALDRNGTAGRTIVIFTSDNGCSPVAGIPALVKQGHNPSGPLRGHKADIFEGGHRIPFLVRWPGRIPDGSTCKDTICLTDLMATCAAIIGTTLPGDAGEDSVSILPDLLGTAKEPVREATVHHSINGSFAIRQGPWKLVLCPDSGGWSEPRPGRPEAKDLPPTQLYNLDQDLGERDNVQSDHPDVVDRLTKLLERYVAEGRSTPGPTRQNHGTVEIRRASKH